MYFHRRVYGGVEEGLRLCLTLKYILFVTFLHFVSVELPAFFIKSAATDFSQRCKHLNPIRFFGNKNFKVFLTSVNGRDTLP